MSALTNWQHDHRRVFILLTGAVIALPLSCARVLPHITKASWVAVVAVATALIAMFYHTVRLPFLDGGNIRFAHGFALV